MWDAPLGKILCILWQDTQPGQSSLMRLQRSACRRNQVSVDFRAYGYFFPWFNYKKPQCEYTVLWVWPGSLTWSIRSLEKSYSTSKGVTSSFLFLYAPWGFPVINQVIHWMLFLLSMWCQFQLSCFSAFFQVDFVLNCLPATNVVFPFIQAF